MCRILKNTKLKKLIIVFLIILLLINIFPNKAQAAGFLESAGGVILDAVLDFLVFLGDTVLNILQNNFISTDNIIIQAQSAEEVGSFSWTDVLMVVIGVIMVVVSIVIAIASWGSLSWASVAGVMAGIKFIGGVILVGAGGTILAVSGTSNLIESLSGKFDLPQIRYTPYEIFSNQIPVFDINFINPMNSIQSSPPKPDNSDINAKEFYEKNNRQNEYRLGEWYGCEVTLEIVVCTDAVSAQMDDRQARLLFGRKDGKAFLSEHNKNIAEIIREDKLKNLVANIFTSKTSDEYLTELLDKNFSITWLNETYLLGEGYDITQNGIRMHLVDIDIDGEIYKLYTKRLDDDKKYMIESEYGGTYNVVTEYWYSLVCSETGESYEEELRIRDDIKKDISRRLSSSIDNTEITEKINSAAKEIRKAVLNLVEKSHENKTVTYNSSAAILQKSISTWYNVLRKIALVGLLSVLVYVGIMIITSSPSGKSKYKKMFLNWVVAVCILFILHYLMILILTVSTKITEIFIEKGEPNIFVQLPADTTINGQGLAGAKSGEAATKDDPPVWSCSFTGYLRLIAGAYGEENPIGLTNFAHSIMYLVMVVYTCIFTVMYLRRVLYMAFLTMIAPLIALTYPLDKIKDGKAQAFGLWLREYIFNALIQPIHLILYIMIVSSVMDYVKDHPVYAIVALGFLLPAEKFIRKLFGFEKPDTLDDNIANVVGGAAVMGGVSKLSALNRPRTHHEDNKDGNVRTANNPPPENIEVPKVDESQNSQAIRTQIEDTLRQLQSQGLSRDEISQRLNDQFGNTELINEVMTRDTGSSSAPSVPQGGNINVAQVLRGPQASRSSQQSNKRGFGSKVASGFLNVGYEARKRSLKAQPLKTIGKYTGMAIGGATLGLVGLVAGISTGELDNTLKFTASGMGIGGTVGGTLGANAGEWTSEQKEAFRKGYIGSEEYNNQKFDKKFLASDELRDMINNRDIHSEMSGGLSKEVHRARAIAKEAHEYHTAGITDSEQISTCMKAGLTSEEGLYAIELAKTMKKGKVNTPQKREEYRRKYEAAFQRQGTFNGNGQKINEIWEVATKIRFK